MNMYSISSSWCFLWWSTFIIVMLSVVIYSHQVQFLASNLQVLLYVLLNDSGLLPIECTSCCLKSSSSLCLSSSFHQAYSFVTSSTIINHHLILVSSNIDYLNSYNVLFSPSSSPCVKSNLLIQHQPSWSFCPSMFFWEDDYYEFLFIIFYSFHSRFTTTELRLSYSEAIV